MTPIARRGLVSMLREAADRLERSSPLYREVIPNGGGSCECGAMGCGTCEPHRDGCPNPQFILDLRTTADAIEKEAR